MDVVGHESSKSKWGYALALILALTLIGAGLIGYFIYSNGSKDYTGGMLVHFSDMAKEMM